MTALTKNQEKEVKKEVHKQVQEQAKLLSNRLKDHASSFKSEFRKHTLTALMAAFGLVIALSWQDLIKKVFATLPKSGILLYHPYLTDLYVSLTVTALSVLAIMILSKWSTKG